MTQEERDIVVQTLTPNLEAARKKKKVPKISLDSVEEASQQDRRFNAVYLRIVEAKEGDKVAAVKSLRSILHGDIMSKKHK